VGEGTVSTKIAGKKKKQTTWWWGRFPAPDAIVPKKGEKRRPETGAPGSGSGKTPTGPCPNQKCKEKPRGKAENCTENKKVKQLENKRGG